MIKRLSLGTCGLLLMFGYACGGGGQTEEEYFESIAPIIEGSSTVIEDLTELLPRVLENPGATWYRRVDADIEHLEELRLELNAIDVPADCEELHGLMEEYLELTLSMATLTRSLGDAPSISKLDEASEVSTEAGDLLELSSQKPCGDF